MIFDIQPVNELGLATYRHDSQRLATKSTSKPLFKYRLGAGQQHYVPQKSLSPCSSPRLQDETSLDPVAWSQSSQPNTRRGLHHRPVPIEARVQLGICDHSNEPLHALGLFTYHFLAGRLKCSLEGTTGFLCILA
mmetsp:Transcript_30150/g.82438  ORF Transcript_30150/g.82438 Transcript_30150/m.82438 type:complete len:135 (-) Transcript_30150:1124-1528(-)